MSGLEFISRWIAALAWPLAIVVILVVFHRPLSELLKRVEKVEYQGLILQLTKEATEAAARMSACPHDLGLLVMSNLGGDRLPVHVAEQTRKVLRARRILAQKFNREPTMEELAAEAQLPLQKVKDLLELIEDPVSLETPVGDGESVYSDLIEDEKTDRPEQTTADRLRHTELLRALDTLNPRMRRVVALRFGLDGELPQTLEEVGAGLGITRERVRQLESRALRELRAVAPALELYLQT